MLADKIKDDRDVSMFGENIDVRNGSSDVADCALRIQDERSNRASELVRREEAFYFFVGEEGRWSWSVVMGVSDRVPTMRSSG